MSLPSQSLTGMNKQEKKTLMTAHQEKGKSSVKCMAPPALTVPVKLSKAELEAQKKMEALQKTLADAAKKKDKLEWELAEEKANRAKPAPEASKASESESAPDRNAQEFQEGSSNNGSARDGAGRANAAKGFQKSASTSSPFAYVRLNPSPELEGQNKVRRWKKSGFCEANEAIHFRRRNSRRVNATKNNRVATLF